MNILIDALPTSIEVNGIDYPIRSDFRTCMRIIVASEDDALTQSEKTLILLMLLYPSLPPDHNAALIAGLAFLNGSLTEDDDSGIRVYSFTKDAQLIFAAFRQTHNIDLTTVELHWWEFMALFMDLGSETAFCSIVNLRRRLATGKASKEERDTARELGSAIDVPTPDTRTLEEREAEDLFLSALGGSHV